VSQHPSATALQAEVACKSSEAGSSGPATPPVKLGVVQQWSTATSPTASGCRRLPSAADLPQRPRAISPPRVRIEGVRGSHLLSSTRSTQEPQVSEPNRHDSRFRSRLVDLNGALVGALVQVATPVQSVPRGTKRCLSYRSAQARSLTTNRLRAVSLAGADGSTVTRALLGEQVSN